MGWYNDYSGWGGYLRVPNKTPINIHQAEVQIDNLTFTYLVKVYVFCNILCYFFIILLILHHNILKDCYCFFSVLCLLYLQCPMLCSQGENPIMLFSGKDLFYPSPLGINKRPFFRFSQCDDEVCIIQILCFANLMYSFIQAITHKFLLAYGLYSHLWRSFPFPECWRILFGKNTADVLFTVISHVVPLMSFL